MIISANTNFRRFLFSYKMGRKLLYSVNLDILSALRKWISRYEVSFLLDYDYILTCEFCLQIYINNLGPICRKKERKMENEKSKERKVWKKERKKERKKCSARIKISFSCKLNWKLFLFSKKCIALINISLICDVFTDLKMQWEFY